MRRFIVTAFATLVPLFAFSQTAWEGNLHGEGLILEEGVPVEANDFGTADTFLYNLNPSDFRAFVGTTVQYNGDAYVEPVTEGFATLIAPIHLPSGVVVDSITVYYYDEHPLADPDLGMFMRWPTDGSAVFGTSTTFGTGAPGWTSATGDVFHMIDNASWHYSYRVRLTRGVGLQRMRLSRVAVRYRRQVSTAPATATFTDVPATHPLFQFVEALAASGITAGCGGGNFCPNDPLTRGQMAVFLAKALGLHWAP